MPAARGSAPEGTAKVDIVSLPQDSAAHQTEPQGAVMGPLRKQHHLLLVKGSPRSPFSQLNKQMFLGLVIRRFGRATQRTWKTGHSCSHYREMCQKTLVPEMGKFIELAWMCVADQQQHYKSQHELINPFKSIPSTQFHVIFNWF